MQACPHLAKLDVRGACNASPLECIRPLHQLKGLRELKLCSHDGSTDNADASELDAQGLASLACLVGLRELTLVVKDVNTMLPYLTSLSELSVLHLASHYTTRTGRPVAVLEFSHLCTLRHLSFISWWSSDCSCDDDGMYGMSFHPSTLPALCSCTQLVRLDLNNHVVKSTADIMALASMPLLIRLAVRRLQPEQRIVAPGCSWESLKIREFRYQDLARLPLAGVKELTSWHIDSSLRAWELGSGRDTDAVEAAADDVHAAALVLDCAYDARHLTELRITWSEVPSCPTAAVVAGLAPLSKHLTLLSLLNWRIDPQLVQQLAEAVPLLQRMELEGCKISSEAWPVYLPLTSLRELEFQSTLVSSENVAYFAASVLGSMTISIDKASMRGAQFRDCKRALEEKRQALGLIERECGIVDFVRI